MILGFGFKYPNPCNAVTQMNKLTPGQMAFMIKSATKVQQGYQAARAAARYLAAHPAMLIALVALLLAVFLRALGWV